MNKPNKLYKYCDQGGLNILETNAIKVSQFFDFNDPFEMNPVFLKEELHKFPDKQIKKEKKRLKRIRYPKEVRGTFAPSKILKIKKFVIRGLKYNFIHTANNNLRILCLSLEPDNLLMWAHYAAQHKGIVIEFNGNHTFFQERINQYPYPNRFSRLVGYSKERHPLSITDLKNKNNVDNEKVIQNTFFIKSSDWSYEKEWRMIFLSEDNDIKEGIINKKRCSLLKLPPNCIRSVILGYKAWETIDRQEPLAKKVIHIIQERQKKYQFPPIEIKRAILDESKYKLKIVKLS